MKSTILGSGSGLGKSGACLCGLEMDIRDSERHNATAPEDKRREFFPTLIVVPVQLVSAWATHIRKFTEGYQIFAYFREVYEKPSNPRLILVTEQGFPDLMTWLYDERKNPAVSLIFASVAYVKLGSNEVSFIDRTSHHSHVLQYFI